MSSWLGEWAFANRILIGQEDAPGGFPQVATGDSGLIALYQQFCDKYEDIQSASYGGQGAVLEDFHTKLMVRLIERIRALAGSKHDDELRARADAALDEFVPVVDSYDWQQHEKEEDDEDDD